MKKIMLIADDDEFILEAYSRQMELDFPDYTVEAYSNPTEVEERFGRGFQGVELVILDQVMGPPDLPRGLDLIIKYSARAKEAGCKMVLHSGEDMENEAIINGAFSYFAKMMTPIVFEESIKRVLKEKKPFRLLK